MTERPFTKFQMPGLPDDNPNSKSWWERQKEEQKLTVFDLVLAKMVFGFPKEE